MMTTIKEAHFVTSESPGNPKYNFFSMYDCLVDYSDLNSSKSIGSSFICRFCGESDRKQFKNKNAHAFPEFTGNKFLFLKEECKNCNERFSSYENELAAHSHTIRSLLGIKGKKGTPKLKTPNLTLKMTDDHLQIKSLSDDNFNLNKNEQGGITQNENEEKFLNIPSQKFNPHKLVKCLVKIGLSVLPEQELSNGDFDKTMKWLIDPDTPVELEETNPFFYAYFGVIQLGKRPPLLMVHKLKKEFVGQTFPSYSIIFGFASHLYQIFIPHCSTDQVIYDQAKISIPICSFLTNYKDANTKVVLIDGNISKRCLSEAYKSFGN